MRTTVTLEPDLAERLKALAHAHQQSFKATLNAVLRRGLDGPAAGDEDGPYVVEPHRGGFQPGVDPGRLNQLLDDLDVAEFAARELRQP